jgi:mRNA interferase MazF
VKSSDPLRRGEIVRVRLNPVEGSEQSGDRPAIVISPDLINLHSPVILVAPITSRKTGKVYPFEALVEPPDGGLSQTSKVLLTQLRAVDKQRISGRYGPVSDTVMERVESALRIAVGLTRL